MSVKEIAAALNFNSQSLFYKFFLSHTGMSPSAYR
ncbi:MAG: AraC family transcriptional regulator, partial [Bacteroidales bacterium]|nr:AraC family transcriptional regulator [Bacteroidales bacterium]